MASIADNENKQVDPRNYRADQGFFTGLSIALSLLIVVGFGQLVARGINIPSTYPLRVHVHAFFLISWLVTFSYQNWLAYKGNIARHRMLGKAAILLVAAIVVMNGYVTVMTVVDGRLAPQFTPGYFFALGAADTLFFAGLVAWGIARKRNTQWHRRLLFGATLILAAAGINRIVNAPLGDLAEPVSIAVQLSFLAVMAWNDRRVYRKVHAATLLLVPIVLFERFLPHVLGDFPPLAEFAQSFAP